MTNGSADNSASNRLQREAQMRFNRMDPMERIEAKQQAYYTQFDAAVATLPPEKAVQVDLMSSYRDDKGTWHLRDIAGEVVAKVRDEGAQEPESLEPTPARSKEAEADRKLLHRCAEDIKTLDKVLVGIIRKAFERIRKLEAQSAIDAEVIAELSKMAERIEAIETRGFRFVGKYQAPATYKTGDVVTYRDALWHCVQDCKVGDRPSTSSHKWSLMMTANQE